MATCYICGKSHAEYRRTVQTGNSNRMGVSSRGRTSTSTTVHYGVRSVCAKCALNIDYKNKKNKGVWGFVLGAFLFGLSIFICFVHGEYFNLGIFGVALGISFCIVPYYISCKKADIWYKENCDKYFDEYDLRQQIKLNTKNELSSLQEINQTLDVAYKTFKERLNQEVAILDTKGKVFTAAHKNAGVETTDDCDKIISEITELMKETESAKQRMKALCDEYLAQCKSLKINKDMQTEYINLIEALKISSLNFANDMMNQLKTGENTVLQAKITIIESNPSK